MAEDPMIAWTMVGPPSGPEPEIAVYADGRVRLAPRFGGGEHRLSKSELEALRHFVFQDQRLLEIDPAKLARAVEAATAKRQRDAAGPAAQPVTGSTMDAGTTVIRVSDGRRTREISHYDLAGDAAAYPDVEALQRLRAVELRLLELAARR